MYKEEKIKVFEGTYDSLEEACLEKGISYKGVGGLRHDKPNLKDLTQKEIEAIEIFLYDGRLSFQLSEIKNLILICWVYGMSVEQYVLETNKDLDFEQRMGIKAIPGKIFTDNNGDRFATAEDMCEYNGVELKQYNTMIGLGSTTRYALEYCANPKTDISEYVYIDSDMVRWPDISSMCAHWCITEAQYRKMRARGITIAKIFSHGSKRGETESTEEFKLRLAELKIESMIENMAASGEGVPGPIEVLPLKHGRKSLYVGEDGHKRYAVRLMESGSYAIMSARDIRNYKGEEPEVTFEYNMWC